MSLHELVWRIGGAARASADWVTLKAGMRLVTPAPAPRCRSIGFSAVDAPAPEFRKIYANFPSTWRDKLVRDAERIVSHRLEIFDIVVTWQDEISWHSDYASHKRAPEPFAALVDYREFDVVGDCKLVWEVNRHHHWVVLARAYYVTGDVRFANEIVAQYKSWREQNQFYFGMNWCSPLELGVRLINWVWAFDMIREVDGVEAIRDDVCYAIQQHCWYTARFQSKASSANNHLIGEAAGLFVAASYLPELLSAKQWLRHAQEILEQQIQAQSYDDGCTREHAFGYQFFVIQFFVICGIVAKKTGVDFSAQYWARLEKMMEFLITLGRGHGSPPLLGDCDDGYVLNLGDHPHDWRSVARLGSVLFGRSDWAHPADDRESAVWLLAASASAEAKPPENPPSIGSLAFAQSGYYLLSGLDSAGKHISVLVDCAELGYGALAAHGHADALSLVVSWDNQPVLIDAGTYDYFTYPEWRNYFRSTRAHNTLEVDGQDQSVMSGPFMWSSRARARICEWAPRADGGRVVGEHDGYSRLAHPVHHRRTIDVATTTGLVEIIDELEGGGAHEVRRHFHFDPQWAIVAQSETKVVLGAGSRLVSLTAAGSPLQVLEPAVGAGPGWISTGYHRKSHCVTVVATDAVDGVGRSLRAQLLLENGSTMAMGSKS
jgi:hypothetical protein